MNTGLFTAALTNGKTAWIGVGGDPYNDFMTIYHGIRLSTARKTGTGTENLSRGARVFNIDASTTTTLLESSSLDNVFSITRGRAPFLLGALPSHFG